jgi:hypothetical protein
MIALTAVLAALLLFINLFNHTIQTAISYQRHKQLATRCSDLLDAILLNPGSPSNETFHWGRRNCTVTSFGLQDSDFTQYRTDSFSLMRLLSSAKNETYSNQTQEWHSSILWGDNGGYLLIPKNTCVDYSTASQLLATYGTYGFQLTITPTLAINIRETGSDPLDLTVQVSGSGLPLSNANLAYLILWSNQTGGYLTLNYTSNATTTNSLGIAHLTFSSNPYIDVLNDESAYTLIVKATAGGLCGMGYKARETITSSGNIIPYVYDYENGIVQLIHKVGKSDSEPADGSLNFTATFYTLSDNLVPTPGNSTTGYVSCSRLQNITIPSGEYITSKGFLLVTYFTSTGAQQGMISMPWGTGTFGVTVEFGDNPTTTTKEWVATDIRQILIGDVSYQAMLALWSLQGYQLVD